MASLQILCRIGFHRWGEWQLVRATLEGCGPDGVDRVGAQLRCCQTCKRLDIERLSMAARVVVADGFKDLVVPPSPAPEGIGYKEARGDFDNEVKAASL